MEQNNNLKLNDIFNIIKAFIRFYNSFKKFNLLICFIIFTGAIAFFFYEKPKYEAVSSFVLMESGGSKIGGLSSLGSQFGIDLGSISGSSNSIFSGDNIFDIFKTKTIIQNVLLSVYSNQSYNKRTLADQYIKMYPSTIKKKIFGKNKDTINYATYSINKNNKLNNSILSKIQQKIITNNLIVERLNKKGSIIQVKVLSSDEDFSLLFNQRLIEAVKSFYLNINNTNTKNTLIGLQNKADSLQRLLFQKSFQSAGLFNANNGLKTYSANEEISQKDKTVAFALYAEVVKNIELTKITQSQQTPIFQIIDSPQLPLETKKLQLIELLLIALGLSLLITLAHAIIKYIVS